MREEQIRKVRQIQRRENQQVITNQKELHATHNQFPHDQ